MLQRKVPHMGILQAARQSHNECNRLSCLHRRISSVYHHKRWFSYCERRWWRRQANLDVTDQCGRAQLHSRRARPAPYSVAYSLDGCRPGEESGCSDDACWVTVVGGVRCIEYMYVTQLCARQLGVVNEAAL